MKSPNSEASSLAAFAAAWKTTGVAASMGGRHSTGPGGRAGAGEPRTGFRVLGMGHAIRGRDDLNALFAAQDLQDARRSAGAVPFADTHRQLETGASHRRPLQGHL